MKRTVITTLLLLTLATSVDAGIFGRAGRAGKELLGSNPPVSEGAVVALAAMNDGRLAALVLDVKHRDAVSCWVLPVGDERRARNKLIPFETLVVVKRVSQGAVDVGELQCGLALRWEPKDLPRKAERNPLLANPAGDLALALRGKPEAIVQFFGEGAPALVPIAVALAEIAETLEAAGLHVDLPGDESWSNLGLLESLRSGGHCSPASAAQLDASPELIELAGDGDVAITEDGRWWATNC